MLSFHIRNIVNTKFSNRCRSGKSAFIINLHISNYRLTFDLLSRALIMPVGYVWQGQWVLPSDYNHSQFPTIYRWGINRLCGIKKPLPTGTFICHTLLVWLPGLLLNDHQIFLDSGLKGGHPSKMVWF